jgi:2-succinyl-5-enolpyruvyl-6-hydroxy-3-cyclohexene-1-carboxylate synthase
VSTAERNHAAALALVTTAINGGIQHAVLSPGSRNTPLIVALHSLHAAGWPVQLHSVIDERAAAFFALGIARRTDRPVLLCCTSGSALTHYFPAITEAAESGVPLLVLGADRPAELQGCGAPQTMPQDGLFGDHVRFSTTIEAPAEGEDDGQIIEAMQTALTAAMGDASGPVHLNVRFRKPLWAPGDAERPLHHPAPIIRTERAPQDADITRLINAAQGQRGVILLGPDPSARHAPDTVRRLAEVLGWPVLADPITRARFGQHGPFIRHQDVLFRSAHFRAQAQPSLVIAVGGTPSSAPIQKLLANTSTIAIHAHRRHWDPFKMVSWTLDADLAPTVTALEAASLTPMPAAWTELWLRADALAASAITAFCAEGLWEGSIAHHLVASLPAGALLRVASSTPIRDVDSFAVDGGHPLTVSSNRGVNGIDGTIATTLGEAWVHAGPVALLSGDLSFLHDLGALSNVPRPTQAVVITVVDNGGGGIFGFLPIKDHPTAFEPWFVTPHSQDISSIVRGFGIQCDTPTSLSEYRDALRSALDRSGLSVIHVRIDRDDSRQQHQAANSSITAQIKARL